MTAGYLHRSHACTLADLTAGLLSGAPTGVGISDLTLDSRAVRQGSLFLACRGQTNHGIEFAQQAVAQGARAVLYDTSTLGASKVPELPSDIFVAGVPQLAGRVGTLA